MSMKHFMNKYIKFIIIAALLVCGANTLQADSSPKTNKVATVKAKKPERRGVRSTNKVSTEARKKHAAAAKKIREAVKAGKLTQAQAKAKYAALRKKIAPARSSKAAILKRFDKNKDGKLCDNEKAAMKKTLAERKKKDAKRGSKSRRERGANPRRGGDRKKRPARK